MGQNVDTKIAELKFDNKQFESSVKQSLDSLNKMETALSKLNSGDVLNKLLSSIEALTKSIDRLSNAADFSKLGKEADIVEKAVGGAKDNVDDLNDTLNETKKINPLDKLVHMLDIFDDTTEKSKEATKEFVGELKEVKNVKFSDILKSAESGLDNFKNRLTGLMDTDAFKKLQDSANGFNTDSAEKSLKTLSDRFSDMGIVGMTVIQNLTNSIVNKLKSSISSVIGTVTSGGLTRALNLEQANFQLQGLGIKYTAADTAAGDYEEVMNAVLGTAYSYDVAAKAASQLAASNIGVTEAEKKMIDGTKKNVKYLNHDMYNAILGIAGVASMTGRGFEDVSQTFTRVAGQGRVMANDLNSLSSMGLNAAATIADYLGKTEKEVRDMVSKGKIDFKTFANAMNSAFGSHAKDSTKMFTGALEDVKAALARTLATPFYKPLLNIGRDLLNSITPVVDEINGKIKPALTNLGTFMYKVSDKWVSSLNLISYASSTTQKEIDSLNSQLSKYNNLAKASDISSVMLAKGILSVKSYSNGSISAIKILSKAYGKTIDEMRADLSDGKVAYSDFTKALRDYANENKGSAEIINRVFTDITPITKRIEKIADVLGLTGELSYGAISKIAAKAKETYNTESDFYSTISEKFGMSTEEFKASAEQGEIKLSELRLALEEVIAELGGDNNKFSRFIYDTLDGVDDSIFKFEELNSAIGKVRGILEKLGKFINTIAKDIKTVYDLLSPYLISAVKAVYGLIKKVYGIIKPSFVGVLDSLKGSFKIIVGLIDTIAKVIVSPLFKTISGLIEKMAKLVSVALDFIAAPIGEAIKLIADGMSDLSKRIANYVKDSGIIKSLISTITGLIDDLTAKIKEITPDDAIKTITDVFNFIKTIIHDALDTIDSIISRFGELFGDIEHFRTIFEGFASMGLITYFGKYIAKFSTIPEFLDTLTSTLSKAKKSFEPILDSVKLLFQNIAKVPDHISKVLDALADGLFALSQSIKADILLKMALGVILLAYSIKMLSEIDFSIDSDGKANGLVALIAVFGLLFTFYKILMNVSAQTTPKKIKKIVDGLSSMLSSIQFLAMGSFALSFAASIVLLAKAVQMIADVSANPEVWALAMISIEALLWSMFGVIKLLAKENPTKITKGIGKVIKISVAILILAKAMQMIGSLDDSGFAKGFVAVEVLLWSFAAMFKAFDKTEKPFERSVNTFPKFARSLIFFSVSLFIIAKAMESMTGLSWKEWGQGLMSMVVLIGTFGIVGSKLTKNVKYFKKMGLSMIIIGLALKVFADAMSGLEGTDWASWGRSMLAIVIILGSMAALSHLLKKRMGRQITGLAISMMFIASAIGQLIEPISAIGSMDQGVLKQAGIAIGLMVGVMTAIGLLFASVSKSTGKNVGLQMIEAGAGMYIVAKGMSVMADSVIKMAALNMNQLINSIGSMIVIMAGLVVVCLILKDLPMLKIGLGVALMATSLSIMAYTALWLSAVPFSKAAKGLFLLLAPLLVFAGASLLKSLPAFMLEFAASILMIAISLKVIEGTSIVAAVTLIGVIAGLGLTMKIFSKTPFSLLILASAVLILASAFSMISDNQASMFSFLIFIVALAGVSALLSALGVGIAAFSLELMLLGAAVTLVGYGFNQLVQGLNGVLTFIIRVKEMISGSGEDIKKEAKDSGTGTIKGFIEGFSLWGAIKTLGKKLKDSIIKGIKELPGKLKGLGSDVLSGFIGGISSKFGELKTKVKQIPQSAIDTIRGYIDKWKQAGSDAIQGFINGLGSKVRGLLSKAGSLGKAAYERLKKELDEHSPSKKFFELGSYATEGFINGLDSLMSKVESSAANVGTSAMDYVKESLSSAADLLNDSSDFNPTITPVVDLSNVHAAARSINASLSAQQAMGISASIANTPSRLDVATNQILSGMKDAFVNASAIQNGGEMQSVTIEVPLNINGREFARATASDIQNQININQVRADRLVGAL